MFACCINSECTDPGGESAESSVCIQILLMVNTLPRIQSTKRSFKQIVSNGARLDEKKFSSCCFVILLIRRYLR